METPLRNELTTLAEVSLSYHPKIMSDQRPKIMGSQDVYDIFSRFWNADKIELSQQFCVMLLDGANKVLYIAELSSGGVGVTVVDIKMVFCIALKAFASSNVIAHSHPSGGLKPICQFIEVAKKLMAAGEIMQIKVHDHLIISSEACFYD